MRDEIFDREYQQGRDALNDGIDRALHAIGDFFATTGRAIHRFEFDAPWQRSQPVKRAKPVKRPRAA
jgi:hypothetical protein